MSDTVFQIIADAYREAHESHERKMKASERAVTEERAAHEKLKEIEAALVKLGYSAEDALAG